MNEEKKVEIKSVEKGRTGDAAISLNALFWAFFKISAVTFGGGYTIVPVIRDEFALKRKLISEDEMLDLVALAQSGPGAMAVSTAILTSYRLRGKVGAVVGLIAAVMPPLLIIAIITPFYTLFAEQIWVRAALRGMSGIISAVLILSVFSMAQKALAKHKVFSVFLMLMAFTLGMMKLINTALIIVILALIGLLTFSLLKEEQVP